MSVLAKAQSLVTALNERERLSRGTGYRRVPWDKRSGGSENVRRCSSRSTFEASAWDNTSESFDIRRNELADVCHELQSDLIPSSAVELDDPDVKIAAYHERIAICLADGASEQEASQIAVTECGCDLAELVARQISQWRQRLFAMPRPDAPWLSKLCQHCLRCLSSPWLHQATTCGWTDADLFGLHPQAPKVRVEAMGLAVAVGLSELPPPLRVISVTPAQATIATGTGALLAHRRFRPSIGPPIWDHPSFQNRRIH